MIPHVLEVRPLEAYQLHLRFDDGSEGVVDLETRLTFRGVFAALAEPSMFRRVSVDPEAGTIDVYRFQEDTASPVQRLTAADTLATPLLAGLTISLAESLAPEPRP